MFFHTVIIRPVSGTLVTVKSEKSVALLNKSKERWTGPLDLASNLQILTARKATV